MTGNAVRDRKGQTNQKKSKKEENSSSVASAQKNKIPKEQREGGDASNAAVSSKPGDTAQQASTKKKTGNKDRSKKGSLIMCLCNKAKYVFLLIFIPPFLNYASLQREFIELKPQGELYDIGWGQKLFLSCRGKGPPTVVLDAPTGMNSDVWTLVVEKLAEQANVCVYDRAGLGFSERPVNASNVPTDDPGSHLNTNHYDRGSFFTVERMAEDLFKLITTSSQQPQPFIFVGAELGAIIGQFYAHLYDSEVLGLVLINPLPDNLFDHSDGVWVQHWFGSLTPTYQTLQLGAALGITRLGLLIGALKQPITGEGVPDEVVLRQKYLLCHPRHLSTVVDEHHFINETFSQMRTLKKLRSLPTNVSVTVLTGNYYDEQMPSHLNKAWARAEQTFLSRFPPGVQHSVINGADRHMMYRKPEPIIEAVLKMVRKWKRSRPLRDTKSS